MSEFKFEDEQDSSLPEVSEELKEKTFKYCNLGNYMGEGDQADEWEQNENNDYEECIRDVLKPHLENKTINTENKELKEAVFSQMVGLSAGIPTAVGAGAISGALGITFLPKLLLQLFKR